MSMKPQKTPVAVHYKAVDLFNRVFNRFVDKRLAEVYDCETVKLEPETKARIGFPEDMVYYRLNMPGVDSLTFGMKVNNVYRTQYNEVVVMLDRTAPVYKASLSFTESEADILSFAATFADDLINKLRYKHYLEGAKDAVFNSAHRTILDLIEKAVAPGHKPGSQWAYKYEYYKGDGCGEDSAMRYFSISSGPSEFLLKTKIGYGRKSQKPFVYMWITADIMPGGMKGRKMKCKIPVSTWIDMHSMGNAAREFVERFFIANGIIREFEDTFVKEPLDFPYWGNVLTVNNNGDE